MTTDDAPRPGLPEYDVAAEQAGTLPQGRDPLREALAAEAHEAWSGWMRYLFGKCVPHPITGDVTIPVALVGRWTRQMATPYRDLPEHEKESDRLEADRYLALVRGKEAGE